MASLQIPDLPDDVYEAPEVTARERRLKILQELRTWIEEEAATRRLSPTPEDLIREDRER